MAPTRKHEFNETDRVLLSIVQENRDWKATDLSIEVNKHLPPDLAISDATCRNRLDKLKKDGYILRDCSILNPAKFNCEQVCFMIVKARSWRDDDLQKFIDVAKREAEVLEVHSISGMCDYILKIRVGSIKDAQSLSKRLGADLASIETLIVGETHKETTAIGLNSAPDHS